MLLVAGAPTLSAGRFVHNGVDVHSDRWSEVDPEDATVRATLLTFVPTHIRVADRQDVQLADHGLELRGNRLIDTRAAAAAAAALAAEPPKPTEFVTKKKKPVE